ncbi:MAG: fumarate hydratase [Pedobacter sp.]|jgi:hypothetical protein
MVKNAFYIFFALILLTSASCKFNPNLQGKGTESLQGIWQEDSVDYQNERLQYSRHQLRFTCDSVYITIKTFAKVNTYPDSCFNKGSWIEYAKGTYLTKGDTLMFTATFTKSNFKQKISGCYRIGQYLPAYIIKKNSGDSLYLESLKQHLQIKLSLKEKIVCVQKPLN